MIIFDKSGALTIMYANPKYDISDDVLDNLGASLNNRKTRTQQTGPGTTGTGSGSGKSQESENQGAGDKK
jgi:hypothetical protein